MPVYEYACLKCGGVFSVLRLSATAEEAVCPSCGSGDVEKKMSVFGCSVQGGSSSGYSGGFSGGG
ncbi:MAG: hypothetical protein Kow0025_13040 [Thermodesulfovibrionales bacterium]